MTVPIDLVIDTNVALDLIVFDDPATRPLAAVLASHQARWLATTGMAAEFARVLHYPALRLDDGAIAAARTAFAARTTPVATPPAPAQLPQCRDPDDQPFLELAVAHTAAALLTRDRALLDLAPRLRRRAPGILLTTPAHASFATLVAGLATVSMSAAPG